MTTESAEVVIRNNADDLRYELVVGGEVVGELRYRVRPDRIALIHTEISPALEGRGLGGRLVAGALDDIRARRQRINPICPFVRSYLRSHPEYADLVA